MTRRPSADHEASYARLEHRAAAPLVPTLRSVQRHGWISWDLELWARLLINNNHNINNNANNNLEQTTSPPQEQGLTALSTGSPGSPMALPTTRKLQSLALVMRCKLRGAAVRNDAWMAEEGKNQTDSGSWDAGVFGHGSSWNLEPVGGFLDGLPAPDKNHRQLGSAPRPWPPRRIGRLLFLLIG